MATFVSLIVAFSIGERFFFDKLFYQKSQIHGYFSKKNRNSGILNPELFIKSRLTDLKELFHSSSDLFEKNKDLNKNSETYIIAVIGDSMSYGLGVKSNEVYAKILEKKLNQTKKTKVYNLSFPGDNFIEHYTKYEKAKAILNPDLFIFAFVENDLVYEESDRYENRDAYQRELAAGCLGEEMEFEWKNLPFDVLVSDYYFPSISTHYANSCMFEHGIERIDKSKTIFAAFDKADEINYSPTEDSSTFEKISHITNYFKYTVERLGGYYLNNQKYNLHSDIISEAEGHISKKTHKKFAEVLYIEIVSDSRWNFIKK